MFAVFTTQIGEDGTHFDDDIFQLGWNHQLAINVDYFTLICWVVVSLFIACTAYQIQPKFNRRNSANSRSFDYIQIYLQYTYQLSTISIAEIFKRYLICGTNMVQFSLKSKVAWIFLQVVQVSQYPKPISGTVRHVAPPDAHQDVLFQGQVRYGLNQKQIDLTPSPNQVR